MNILTVQIAKYLDSIGLGIFDETGVSGTIYIACLPQTPDEIFAIYPTGGGVSDGKLQYDNPTIQIIVRGTANPITAVSKAQAIYDKLQGFHHDYFIAGGYWILNCIGLQSQPIHIGRDETGRHEFSLNFQLEIYNENRR